MSCLCKDLQRHCPPQFMHPTFVLVHMFSVDLSRKSTGHRELKRWLYCLAFSASQLHVPEPLQLPGYALYVSGIHHGKGGSKGACVQKEPGLSQPASLQLSAW